jgi:hypothetical protein
MHKPRGPYPAIRALVNDDGKRACKLRTRRIHQNTQNRVSASTDPQSSDQMEISKVEFSGKR